MDFQLVLRGNIGQQDTVPFPPAHGGHQVNAQRRALRDGVLRPLFSIDVQIDANVVAVVIQAGSLSDLRVQMPAQDHVAAEGGKLRIARQRQPDFPVIAVLTAEGQRDRGRQGGLIAAQGNGQQTDQRQKQQRCQRQIINICFLSLQFRPSGSRFYA